MANDALKEAARQELTRRAAARELARRKVARGTGAPSPMTDIASPRPDETAVRTTPVSLYNEPAPPNPFATAWDQRAAVPTEPRPIESPSFVNQLKEVLNVGVRATSPLGRYAPQLPLDPGQATWEDAIKLSGSAAAESSINTLKDLVNLIGAGGTADKFLAGKPEQRGVSPIKISTVNQEAASAVCGSQNIGQNLAAGFIQLVPYLVAKAKFPMDVAMHPESLLPMVKDAGVKLKTMLKVAAVGSGKMLPYDGMEKDIEALRQEPVEHLAILGMAAGLGTMGVKFAQGFKAGGRITPLKLKSPITEAPKAEIKPGQEIPSPKLDLGTPITERGISGKEADAERQAQTEGPITTPGPSEKAAPKQVPSKAIPPELKVGQKVYIQLPKHRKPKIAHIQNIMTDESGKPIKVDVDYGGITADTRFLGKQKKVTMRATVNPEDITIPASTIRIREYHEALAKVPVEDRPKIKTDAKKFDELANDHVYRFMTPEELAEQERVASKDIIDNKYFGEKAKAIQIYQGRKEARAKMAEQLGVEDIDNPVVRAKALPLLEKHLYNNPPTGGEVPVSALELKPGDRVKMLGEWYDVEPSETPGGLKLKDGITLDIQNPNDPAWSLQDVEDVKRRVEPGTTSPVPPEPPVLPPSPVVPKTDTVVPEESTIVPEKRTIEPATIEARKYKTVKGFAAVQRAKFIKEQGREPISDEILNNWFKAKQIQGIVGIGHEAADAMPKFSDIPETKTTNFSKTPDGKLILYRGIPKNVKTKDIRYGDFLSPKKAKAQFYGEVSKYEVDPRDVRFLSGDEVVFAPEGGKPNIPEPLSIVDFYNTAKQTVKSNIEPPIKPPEVREGIGGPRKESSLAIRAEIDAIEAKLTEDFGDLPEYKTMNMKDQAARAQEILDADYEQAKRIAMGTEYPPSGLREASVFEAVKIRALKEGDVETLRNLATESTIPTKLSEYGQAIKAADSKLMEDPVKVMRDVAKTREEQGKRIGVKKVNAAELERLRTELETTKAALDKAIAEKVAYKRPATYGQRNKVVTVDAYQQALAELKAKTAATQLNVGIDPSSLPLVAKIGAFHFEAGLREFGNWSIRMVEDAGEWVKPHLATLWLETKNNRRQLIALKSQKTRYSTEIRKLNERLNNLDFAKAEKRATLLDPEAKILKQEYERIKENYKAASGAAGVVTKEEAAKIVQLSQVTADARTVWEQNIKEHESDLEQYWKSNPKERFDYGAARVNYEHYIGDLKGENLPIKTLLKNRAAEFKTDWKTNKPQALTSLGGDAIKVIADNSVAMVATLDNSFLGRQGLHTLQTHPTAWWDGAKNSFADMVKTLGGKDAHDALMADIYSRPNYMNGDYIKAKLIPQTEEQFPTSLPERIPGVGRVFKASEHAFTGSAIRMRTDLYDLLSSRAKENGVPWDAVHIKDLGKMINALTARGTGRITDNQAIRLVMWAPKMLKGNIDVLTGHGLGSGLETAFARKQAAINLFKIVSETATVMMIANALKPGSAEYDPRSSDFGKIKVGNTRFDITGGAGSVVVLASRLISNSSKSTATGKITPYGIKFGQPSRFDAMISFLTNKTNPPAHFVASMLKGKDFSGAPFSAGKALYGAATPITIQQAIALKDSHSADQIAGLITDWIGISSNTYEPKKNKGTVTINKP